MAKRYISKIEEIYDDIAEDVELATIEAIDIHFWKARKVRITLDVRTRTQMELIWFIVKVAKNRKIRIKPVAR